MDGPTPNPLEYQHVKPSAGKAWFRQAMLWIVLLALIAIVLRWGPSVLHRFEVLAWQGQLKDWEFDPVKPIKTATVIVQPGPNRWPAYRAEALGSVAGQGTLLYCHEYRTRSGESRVAAIELVLVAIIDEGFDLFMVNAMTIKPAGLFNRPNQLTQKMEMRRPDRFVSVSAARVITENPRTVRFDLKYENRTETIDVTFDDDQTPKIEQVK